MPGNEDLRQTAVQCHRILADADISHTVCGDVAVCLNGYQRNTVDLDLIISGCVTASWLFVGDGASQWFRWTLVGYDDS